MNFDSESLDLLGRLGIALALGLLIGIERGWREREAREGSRTAGIRTFALLGLSGGIAGALVSYIGALAPAIIIATLGAVFAVFRYRENVAENDFSVTSVVAAFAVMMLGAFAVIGEPGVAVSAGIAALVLLAVRHSLHSWLKRLTWAELRAGVLLLAMTFLALPVLPDRAIDPWGAINPHELWLMTILIAAISAAGYGAVRIGGPERGTLFGAFAGALVSSTAVTFNLANRAKAQSGSLITFAAAAALASTVSLLRVLVIVVSVALAHSQLFFFALVPAAAITLGCAAIAWRLGKRGKSVADGSRFELGNPLDLGAVLSFAALLALVLVVSKVMQAQFGEPGFLALAAIAGAADVDPITLTAAKLAVAGQLKIALAGALLAVLMNFLSKVLIGFYAGGGRFGLLHLGLLIPAFLILGGWLAWALGAL